MPMLVTFDVSIWKCEQLRAPWSQMCPQWQHM